MALLASILSFVVACAAALPLHAAESPPDFALKTKAASVSITLDDAIRANPSLAADCLAEGKRYARKHEAESEKSLKADPKLFADRGYTFERAYTTASVIGNRYVSVIRTDYENTGGAHPNTYVNTILWDDIGKKRVSIRPFFKETADGGPTLRTMVRGVISALNDEKKKRGITDNDTGIDWYNGIEPSLLKIGPVTLAPSSEPDKSSGLIFHYEPYAVGPYAEGSFEAFVSWRDLQPHLSTEGKAIFGGELPPGAANKNQ